MAEATLLTPPTQLIQLIPPPILLIPTTLVLTHPWIIHSNPTDPVLLLVRTRLARPCSRTIPKIQSLLTLSMSSARVGSLHSAIPCTVGVVQCHASPTEPAGANKDNDSGANQLAFPGLATIAALLSAVMLIA
ncbi:hypothetical protein BCR41DRAFT_11801 [Lobosporangium transversale]|uniref:Uncharacterized protein n=1 Tax=Lobosporangium transversale TaxID=64571 RepID=A0A1Y2H3M1_9FUNG|nr:hypothetical protein BCR41DRAFT_11801 [Lobosporangium transversale]ORZ29115.1 hypothetical protein BCR41DRAFT_11801 [Lobosporangium transversale]|eukprot:XP_021886788.1 hypothetical protein BCR41DRAFT_11801 [Lobosporangium transversale]